MPHCVDPIQQIHRIHPGTGLALYCQRLKKFSKPDHTYRSNIVSSKSICIEEFLEIFPKRKPVNHKLSFIDDPPYVAIPEPYNPDYISDLFTAPTVRVTETRSERNYTICENCTRKVNKKKYLLASTSSFNPFNVQKTNTVPLEERNACSQSSCTKLILYRNNLPSWILMP